MNSQIETALSTSNTAPAASWPRAAVGVLFGLLLALFILPVFRGGNDAADVDTKLYNEALPPACTQWDEQAGEAIARIVKEEGRRDVRLRQAGDAIFRLRRARRNCQSGWVSLACQDYLLIVQQAPGLVGKPPECAAAH